RFEDADRRAAGSLGVDDRGDLAVRADFDKGCRELFALRDVHRLYGVRQAHLFERHADLAAVRGIPGVKFDAHRDRPLLRNCFVFVSLETRASGLQATILCASVEAVEDLMAERS